MASDTYHEPYDLLSPATREMHRGIVSLMEELEAIDWYQQRADACGDAELRAVLIHNKNEEIEHAMMTLEWLRRTSAEFDANIRTYLIKEGPITEIEAAAEVAGNGNGSAEDVVDPDGAARPGPKAAPAGPMVGAARGSLGIGSLRAG